jgi:hypothetical protein
MKSTRWLAIIFCLIVIASCFFSWIHIESKNIYFGGFKSDADTYGKPGILHVFLCLICLSFLLINKIWSVRASFFVSAFNIVWAARNFFLMSACSGGDCPLKLPAFYVLLISSILLTVSILFVRPKDALNDSGAQR